MKSGCTPLRVLQPLMRETDAEHIGSQRLIEDAQRYGAEAILLNCGGFSAWYPTKLDSQRVNPHMRGDLFGKLTAQARAAGLKVIARLDLSKGYQDWYEAHPEWFSQKEDGAPSSMWGLYEICFTGPYYQEKAFDIIKEIVADYDIDGIFINFFRIKQCYCPRCRATVYAQAGCEVPPAGEFSLPYHRWRQKALVDYTQRLTDYIHTLNPSVQTIVYHHVREGWDMAGMAKAVDLYAAQASNPVIANPVDPQPKWTYWPGEQTQLGRALKPEKAPVVVNTYSAFFASRRTAQPHDRLSHDLIEVAAHGGTTIPALNGTFEQDDPRALPGLEKLGHYLLRNRAYYQGLTSIAKVALMYSPDSVLLGHDQGAPSGNSATPGHVDEFRGFYEMLVQSRRPFDLLVEGSLEKCRLSQYSAILLPGVCCLSQEEADLLDEYVQGGGKLIVTADTATITKQGEASKRMFLYCVGQTVVESINANGAYFTVSSAELADKLGGTSILGLAGEFLITSPDNAGDLHGGLQLVMPVQSNAPEFSDLEPPSEYPGLFTRMWGKGRTYYLPWRIGALFHQYAWEDYFTLCQYLLDQAVGWSPIVTDAPNSVEIICYDLAQDSQKPARVVHFLNATALQGKTLIKTITLPGFQVQVEGYYTKAKSLVSSELLPLTYQDGYSRFSLPKLETFDAVVLS